MNLPAPRPSLDRAALERVLARAAELQSQASAISDSGGALSDEQILDLGKEVGLTPDAMRQAIAEERGRVEIPDASGIAGQWFGPTTLSAARVVPGAPAAILTALDNVMRSDLPFDVSRRFPDRTQWTPRRGFLDAMRTQLSRNSEGLDLKFADGIAASVVAVDAQRTHVRVDASIGDARSGASTRSAMLVASSSALGTLFVLTGLTIAIAAPVFGGVALAGLIAQRNRHRSNVERVAIALEQLLDRLEFGPAKRKGGLVDKLLGQ